MPWRANINKIKNQKAQQIRHNHNTIHQNNTYLKHRGTFKIKRRKKTLSAFIQALFNHPHTQKNIHKSPQNINRIFDSLPPPTTHKNHFHITSPHTNAVQNYTYPPKKNDKKNAGRSPAKKV